MEKKKNNLINVAKIVVLLLCAVNVVCSVISFVDDKNSSVLFGIIVNCLTLYYMFVAYKNPHGNLLRYLFIIVTLEAMFAFWRSFSITARIQDVYDLLLLLEIIIIAYISGRLNKYKENIILFVIALAILFICGANATKVFNITSTIKKIVPFEQFTILSALFVSYIARYREHIEAGIEEDKN